MTQFAEYAAHGWRLCAIDRGQKGPVYGGWNVKPIPADALDGLDGAGLLHALSGTCALDLDHIESARPWLAERGVDLDALLEADDAVRIESGRHGRNKLLYRMKRPLRTLKPKGSGLELRCATANGASVQDVLPPSIHPDTKMPYQWGGGILSDWRNLPTIPANLLSVWRSLINEAPDEIPAQEEVREAPSIDLTKLRKAAFKHSPECEYDEWLKVGMQLHDGTGGAQEGFDIWAQWSRGIKRKPYPGDVTLKSHWLSFSSKGKHVASGAALVAELPAEADEFPIEVNAVLEAETTEAIMEQTKSAIRQQAIEKLEQRLVLVRNAERYFDTEHHTLIGSDNAIEHLFTAIMPKAKGGRMNPVKVLKASATKRVVDSLAFHPGEKAIFARGTETYANSYRDRLPEPIEPMKDERERIEWLFDRIDDIHFRKWLLQFYAHVVQHPGVKIKSAPLIWSDTQGNGKSTLVKTIPALLVGQQYSKDVTVDLLNSAFSDYLAEAWHVNLIEFRAGTRGEREAISKKIENWIADDTLSMHPKGMRGYTMPNHMFLTASSNKDDAASIDNNDRKWAIHELHAPQFTEDEQTWIYHSFLLTPRAAGVLRHYFLNVPLDGFVASAKAPETDARQEMVAASIPADYELLLTAFEQRSEPLTRDVVITQEVTDYVRRHSLAKPSSQRIGRMLCRPPFNGKNYQWRVGESRYRGIVFRGPWVGAGGKEIMAHISGEDSEISVDLTR
jgi:hypothetical protein